MKLEKVKSVNTAVLESKKEDSLANPIEPIETKVDVIDAETAAEEIEKTNKEVNKRIKDIEKNALAVKGEDHAEEPKLVKESKEFKKEERKELGAFIHDLKEKKIKHIVKRSVNEGYRYLVEYLNPVKEEAEDTVTELCPFCEEEVELKAIKYIPQKCPNCGKLIKACSLCDLNKVNCTACEKKYPTEAANESLKEEKESIDLEALRFYVKNWSEGDNITVTADLLNVLEQALEMAEKHGLEESKIDEVDLQSDSTKQLEIKPEQKIDPENKDAETDSKQEVEVEEGAEGKKEPGVEFVVFDASTEGKAPILGIRSTRVEAEWLMNRLMNTGKYDNVSFDEAPKGRFHKGDDFWGPFDGDDWKESLKEDKTSLHSGDKVKIKGKDEIYLITDISKDNDGIEIYNLVDAKNPEGEILDEPYYFNELELVNESCNEAIDTSKEVWEGWTVQDFIDELEPSFEQIMSGDSWVKPFANKEELKKWCISEQPYYKKYIPEVVSYFDGRVKEFGGYGKKASDGLYDSLKEEEETKGPEVDYGKQAWLLNEIISSFNNEGAYYSTGWLYIWPDGCSREDCNYYFGNESDYKDLEDSFKRVYKSSYRKDGFYKKPSPEALELAHKFDTELGLPAMEILGESVKEVKEEVLDEKKDVFGLSVITKGPDGKVIRQKKNFEVGTQAEMEEKKKGLEDTSPEDSSGNKNEYVVKQIKEPKKEGLEESFEEIYIKYWEDEELRDQGISEIYRDNFATREEAIEVARKLVDRDGFASVEVFVSPSGEIESADDKLIWGYDGVDTWKESLEKKATATITNEEFENIDEDDVSWMTSTDISALKENKVDESEVREPTTKKVVNFEDVEEDDISWLK